jgi:hypothetical protein
MVAGVVPYRGPELGRSVAGRYRQVDGEQRDGDGHHGVGKEDQPVYPARFDVPLAIGRYCSHAVTTARPTGDAGPGCSIPPHAPQQRPTGPKIRIGSPGLPTSTKTGKSGAATWPFP